MADVNITLGSSTPSNDVNPGDKITWTNDTGYNISSFTLPTCVSPQTSPAPIANGATTRQYTVNSGSKGDYSYSWFEDDPSAGTRSGTIDVN